jgi:hypothetical protein
MVFAQIPIIFQKMDFGYLTPLRRKSPLLAARAEANRVESVFGVILEAGGYTRVP